MAITNAYVLIALVTLSASGICAQHPGRGSLQGEITPPPASRSVFVELYHWSNRELAARTDCDSFGRFRFDQVRSGDYVVRITGPNGNRIHEGFAQVTQGYGFIAVRLPDQKNDRPASGTISVAQLQRTIPKPARKEFEKALRETKKGNADKAIPHLEKALSIFPDFMEAHNNLGVRLFNAGDVERAIHHFERAIELDPAAAGTYRNLAAAFMKTGRDGAAERAAREAVRLNPAVASNRYVLGIALARTQQNEEAVRYLASAADEYPKARLALATLLSKEGRRTEAAEQVRQYLPSSDGPERAPLQAWLARLEDNQQESGSH